MKYKSNVIEYCKLYIIFALSCAGYWIYRNGDVIENEVDAASLPNLVGLNNGYRYQWILATVILLGYIFMIKKDMSFTSEFYLIRNPRDKIIGVNLVRVIVNAVLYVAIYTMIDMIFVVMVTDIHVLIESNFFIAIFLFDVSLTTVYVVMGTLYILVYLLVDNSYLSLIILFTINILIVFAESYMHVDIIKFYTNIGVIDEIVSRENTNIFDWAVVMIIQMMLGITLCICIKKIYYRKDIISTDVKK